MECVHCRGVMLKERLYDLIENDGQFYVSGWRWANRCIACGKVLNWGTEEKRQTAGNVVTVDERTTVPSMRRGER
jgi:hypothetical protein